ncbi:hypothetical protein [Deinococcus arcticus]|uniref:hypothetical protein n=1 Tax=Deinococcus arcticus TaxID=2136176 RepID=UPI001304AC50|nr:hypothetical protein [Deinococcus arcticus]
MSGGPLIFPVPSCTLNCQWAGVAPCHRTAGALAAFAAWAVLQRSRNGRAVDVQALQAGRRAREENL